MLNLAARLCDQEAAQHIEKCRKTKESFLEAVNHLDYKINGDQSFCIPSTINISFDGIDAESYFVALKDNYAFSNGSACNSGSHEPSYVLTSMGLDEKRVNEAIRISWNYDTDVDFSKLVDYINSMK